MVRGSCGIFEVESHEWELVCWGGGGGMRGSTGLGSGGVGGGGGGRGHAVKHSAEQCECTHTHNLLDLCGEVLVLANNVRLLLHAHKHAVACSVDTMQCTAALLLG